MTAIGDALDAKNAANTQTALENTETKANATASEVETARGSSDTLGDEVSAIKSTANAASSAINAAKGSSDTLADEVSAIKTTANAASTGLATTQTAVTALTGEVTTVKTTANSSASAIALAAGNSPTLKTELSRIEAVGIAAQVAAGTVTKDIVGLANADNTSDDAKPVSVLQQVEFDRIDTRVDAMQEGFTPWTGDAGYDVRHLTSDLNAAYGLEANLPSAFTVVTSAKWGKVLQIEGEQKLTRKKPNVVRKGRVDQHFIELIRLVDSEPNGDAVDVYLREYSGNGSVLNTTRIARKVPLFSEAADDGDIKQVSFNVSDSAVSGVVIDHTLNASTARYEVYVQTYGAATKTCVRGFTWFDNTTRAADSDSAAAVAADKATVQTLHDQTFAYRNEVNEKFIGAYASDVNALAAFPDPDIGARYFRTSDNVDRQWNGSSFQSLDAPVGALLTETRPTAAQKLAGTDDNPKSFSAKDARQTAQAAGALAPLIRDPFLDKFPRGSAAVGQQTELTEFWGVTRATAVVNSEVVDTKYGPGIKFSCASGATYGPAALYQYIDKDDDPDLFERAKRLAGHGAAVRAIYGANWAGTVSTITSNIPDDAPAPQTVATSGAPQFVDLAQTSVSGLITSGAGEEDIRASVVVDDEAQKILISYRIVFGNAASGTNEVTLCLFNWTGGDIAPPVGQPVGGDSGSPMELIGWGRDTKLNTGWKPTSVRFDDDLYIGSANELKGGLTLADAFEYLRGLTPRPGGLKLTIKGEHETAEKLYLDGQDIAKFDLRDCRLNVTENVTGVDLFAGMWGPYLFNADYDGGNDIVINPDGDTLTDYIAENTMIIARHFALDPRSRNNGETDNAYYGGDLARVRSIATNTLTLWGPLNGHYEQLDPTIYQDEDSEAPNYLADFGNWPYIRDELDGYTQANKAKILIPKAKILRNVSLPWIEYEDGHYSGDAEPWSATAATIRGWPGVIIDSVGGIGRSYGTCLFFAGCMGVKIPAGAFEDMDDPAVADDPGVSGLPYIIATAGCKGVEIDPPMGTDSRHLVTTAENTNDFDETDVDRLIAGFRSTGMNTRGGAVVGQASSGHDSHHGSSLDSASCVLASQIGGNGHALRGNGVVRFNPKAESCVTAFYALSDFQNNGGVDVPGLNGKGRRNHTTSILIAPTAENILRRVFQCQAAEMQITGGSDSEQHSPMLVSTNNGRIVFAGGEHNFRITGKLPFYDESAFFSSPAILSSVGVAPGSDAYVKTYGVDWQQGIEVHAGTTLRIDAANADNDGTAIPIFGPHTNSLIRVAGDVIVNCGGDVTKLLPDAMLNAGRLRLAKGGRIILTGDNASSITVPLLYDIDELGNVPYAYWPINGLADGANVQGFLPYADTDNYGVQVKINGVLANGQNFGGTMHFYSWTDTSSEFEQGDGFLAGPLNGFANDDTVAASITDNLKVNVTLKDNYLRVYNETSQAVAHMTVEAKGLKA
ncbi:hypothetical protein FF098_014875 [Parvularcula flava]|uniref:Uncharacterized protein n=1 Tax=Aquisalinus luteolus TaxID=1566827 RepID=A0A8J3EPW2_9PROT|nr:hypothetical protein [Aquisalinus luteolus]NHK29202.1 hypothetical protein [Aquisalinus luteolus]GGH99990.1 hypothetical protein GCM10011355_27230 [Aquisalinus luteolus]